MVLWDRPTVPSWRKEAVKSKGMLMDSACVRPSEMAPSRPRAKRTGPGGRLVAHPSPLWIFLVQIPLVTISAQAQRYSSDFLKKTGPDNRVEGVLQVHGQEAPVFLSLFVFPEPTS